MKAKENEMEEFFSLAIKCLGKLFRFDPVRFILMLLAMLALGVLYTAAIGSSNYKDGYSEGMQSVYDAQNRREAAATQAYVKSVMQSKAAPHPTASRN